MRIHTQGKYEGAAAHWDAPGCLLPWVLPPAHVYVSSAVRTLGRVCLWALCAYFTCSSPPWCHCCSGRASAAGPAGAGADDGRGVAPFIALLPPCLPPPLHFSTVHVALLPPPQGPPAPAQTADVWPPLNCLVNLVCWPKKRTIKTNKEPRPRCRARRRRGRRPTWRRRRPGGWSRASRSPRTTRTTTPTWGWTRPRWWARARCESHSVSFFLGKG